MKSNGQSIHLTLSRKEKEKSLPAQQLSYEKSLLRSYI